MRMAHMLWRGFPILFVFSFAVSSPWSHREFTTHPSLLDRQANEESALCYSYCESNTCGSSCPASVSGLQRRSFDDYEALSEQIRSINVSEAHQYDEVYAKSLSKRIWRFDVNSNNPVGDAKPTWAQANKYLPAVFKGAEDAYFGEVDGLFAGDERAVSIFEEYGKEPFQIGTNGIHGCTTITLVSNRAVWMAHFWETYSNQVRPKKDPDDVPNSDEPPDHPLFVQRVLQFIRGEPVEDPAPHYGKAYILPQGEAPDPKFFNQEGDGTTLIISMPIPLKTTLSRRSPPRYPKRLEAIKEAFETRLGFKPDYVQALYQALDYSDPKQYAEAGTTNKGHHLFQYDPNSDGKGQRAYRTFTEAVYKMVKLPPLK